MCQECQYITGRQSLRTASNEEKTKPRQRKASLTDSQRFEPSSVIAFFSPVEAFECGYCTSGMIMSAVALLKQNPAPNDDAIRDFMNGNICRCCTYPRIVEAVKQAAGAEQTR